MAGTVEWVKGVPHVDDMTANEAEVSHTVTLHI